MRADGRSPAAAPTRVPPRVLAAILLGTVLNPINSSMIAVALVRIGDDFDVGDRLAVVADLELLPGRGGRPVGARPARRPVRPAARCSAPASCCRRRGRARPARAELRLADRGAAAAGGRHLGRLPGRARAAARRVGRASGRRPSTLAAITIAGLLQRRARARSSAARSWRSPAGRRSSSSTSRRRSSALPLALRWLPRDPQHAGGVDARDRAAARRPAGDRRLHGDARERAGAAAVARRASRCGGWRRSRCWPAPRSCASDRRREDPFLDVRMLAGNRALLGVCAQYLLVNVVAFGVFFALPLWLEAARGFSSGAAGPAGRRRSPASAVFATPFAARLVGAPRRAPGAARRAPARWSPARCCC